MLEATYTGRFARHLLQEIDLSQPLDLVDPSSKMDYFAAAQMLSKAAYAGTHRKVPSLPFRTGRTCSHWQRGAAEFRAMLRVFQPSYRYSEYVRSLLLRPRQRNPGIRDRGRILLPGLCRCLGHSIPVLPAAILLAVRLADARQQQLQRPAGQPAACHGGGPAVRFQLHLLEIHRRRIERGTRQWF